MPSKNRIVGYLKEKDMSLFKAAITRYGKEGRNSSELIREIIHAWLYTNRLSLQSKHKNSKEKND